MKSRSYRAEKTRNRIEIIKTEIASFNSTIALLDAHAEGRKKIKGGIYSPYAIGYIRTLQDQRRYQWTRKNLKAQLTSLEFELKILMEYGI